MPQNDGHVSQLRLVGALAGMGSGTAIHHQRPEYWMLNLDSLSLTFRLNEGSIYTEFLRDHLLKLMSFPTQRLL